MKRILSYDRISERNSFEEDSYDNFLNFQRSRSKESVIVKQCKLKRNRFVFLGRDVHTVENFGGKAEPLKSFRSEVKCQEDSEMESIHSDSVKVI